MNASFAALGAVKLFPVTPRFDLHQLEYVAGEDLACMPAIFTKNYFDEVPPHVVLLDPVGNEFDGVLIKMGDKVMLTGCLRLGSFYGLHLGGYLRMIYLGLGKFIMQVFNNYGHEAVYPPLAPPMPIVPSGNTRVGSMRDACGSGTLSDNDYMDFYLMFMKTLTQQDMAKSYLVLPRKFCRRALPNLNCEVKLVEEDGTNWNCFLDHDLPTGDGSAIKGAWARLRVTKDLKEGDEVLVGVTGPNSDVIYYINN